MDALRRAGISRTDTRFVCMLTESQQKAAEAYIRRTLRNAGVLTEEAVEDAMSGRVVDLFR